MSYSISSCAVSPNTLARKTRDRCHVSYGPRHLPDLGPEYPAVKASTVDPGPADSMLRAIRMRFTWRWQGEEPVAVLNNVVDSHQAKSRSTLKLDSALTKIILLPGVTISTELKPNQIGTTMATTEQIIETIIETVGGQQCALRQRYFLRELLRNLVRVARVEHELELKRSDHATADKNTESEYGRQSFLLTKRLLNGFKLKQSD